MSSSVKNAEFVFDFKFLIQEFIKHFFCDMLDNLKQFNFALFDNDLRECV